MIKHIPFESLFLADHGWLKSRFHFSFAEYRDMDNMNYGPLRVMNDDIIGAYKGFGEHPHNDMEIVTYVLRGELTHQDSMGHMESLGRGAVQYMSAGTGITHSEINAGEEELHLIQTWIIPQAKNLEPQYGSREFELEERQNKWLHIVGPIGSSAKIKIYQDASMYASEMDAGEKLDFNLQKDRALYVKVMEGCVNINGILFSQGDAAKVEDENLHVEAVEKAHILLVEIAKKN